MRTSPPSDSASSRPANDERAPRLQNDRMPPWRVSRVSAKDELVSRFSTPKPIELRPRSNSPPSDPAIPFIGSAAKPIPPPAGLPIPAARPIDPAAAPSGEPDRAPPEPAPWACMPADDPSWLRKSSAISRSMPGRDFDNVKRTHQTGF